MNRFILSLIGAGLLVSSLTSNSLAGQPEIPKHEFRSVWVATVWGGLDWGGQGWPSPEERMNFVLNRAERLGLNAIVFQVIGRGDAMYESERLPWAYNLTGEPGGDPGYDPLQMWIDGAHERGLELHAWVNVFNVSYNNETYDSDDDQLPNVRYSHPEWIENDTWLNAGIPEAREWMVDNILELVENYDIDAVHYDYIRYDQGGYSNDSETMSEYNPEDISTLGDWRRYNVNEFAREVHEDIQKIKPWVKTGAAPVGHYDRDSADGWGALWGYSSVYQDSRHWAEQGHIDYIAPQIYWTIGEAPRFEYIVSDWVQNRKNDRHLYIGTNPANHSVKSQIHRQIDTTRTRGAEGQIHFRYQSIADDWGIFTSGDFDRYGNKAIVPPMPWRDMEAPGPVENLLVQSDDLEVNLAWSGPGQDEEEARFRYAVYRVDARDQRLGAEIIEDASNLLMVTGETSYTDEFEPEGRYNEYRYLVTALSRNNVESEAAEDQIAVSSISGEPVVAEDFELKQNYPNPFNPATTISFRIPESGHTTLVVYDMLGQQIATLLDENLPAGTHNVRFEAEGLASGVYIYRLRSGDYTETRRMTYNK